MSKGLEALKELNRYIPFYEDNIIQDIVDENYHIVEKALEAFEVVRNRIIDVYDFLVFDTFSSFNQRRATKGLSPISKKEYDLLKEVLLWAKD